MKYPHNDKEVPDHDKYGFLAHLHNTVMLYIRNITDFERRQATDPEKADLWRNHEQTMRAGLEVRLQWWKQATGKDFTSTDFIRGREEFNRMLERHGLRLEDL